MKLTLAALAVAATAFSSLALADIVPIETCAQLVNGMNSKDYASYDTLSLKRDLDCQSSPTLTRSINASIEGSGHTIYNLHASLAWPLLNGGSLVEDLNIVNATVHYTQSTELLSIDSRSRWSNVKLITPTLTGAQIDAIVSSIRDAKVQGLTVDLGGQVVQSPRKRGLFVYNDIEDSTLENIIISNVDWKRTDRDYLLASSGENSDLTNIKFSNIKMEGSGGTGEDAGTSFGVEDASNLHINGYTLDNIRFARAKRDSLLALEEEDTLSTYRNVTHNLFGSSGSASTMPVVFNPKDNLEKRVSNINSMNSPTQPPAICTPYLARDTFFGVADNNLDVAKVSSVQ